MAADLTELTGEWVACRTLLHAWEEIPLDAGGPREVHATRSVAILLFRCTRCGTKRYDAWSRVTGDLVHRAYRTPEGYSLPKGRGRKVLVRKEYLRRQSTNGKRPSRKIA
jgi:hypothetical protein